MSFIHPTLVTQSWYVAARSRELRRGEAKSFDLLRRRITLYRDQSGVVRAIDAQCPHFGADLGKGKVIGDRLQCSFHGLCFSPEGRAARHDSSFQTRVYSVVERWGLIWIFNGPEVLFELPDAPANEPLRVLRLPPRRINCHPHLVIANGLDIAHYESLHLMSFTAPPRLSPSGNHRLTLQLRGRPSSRRLQLFTGTTQREINADFTTIGGSLAWATVSTPIRFHMLFTGRPNKEGQCETQVLLFFPTGAWRFAFRALALMYLLLYDDHRILDGVRFTPNFTEQDAPLKAFAEQVESLGAW
jgi:phenylpropionate dioxygenase-like ring-hydroxylating dioxygenase large terminal subunit